MNFLNIGGHYKYRIYRCNIICIYFISQRCYNCEFYGYLYELISRSDNLLHIGQFGSRIGQADWNCRTKWHWIGIYLNHYFHCATLTPSICQFCLLAFVYPLIPSYRVGFYFISRSHSQVQRRPPNFRRSFLPHAVHSGSWLCCLLRRVCHYYYLRRIPKMEALDGHADYLRTRIFHWPHLRHSGWNLRSRRCRLFRRWFCCLRYRCSRNNFNFLDLW